MEDLIKEAINNFDKVNKEDRLPDTRLSLYLIATELFFIRRMMEEWIYGPPVEQPEQEKKEDETDPSGKKTAK